MYLHELKLESGDLFKRKIHRAYWEVNQNGIMNFCLMEPKDLQADDWEIQKKETTPITLKEWIRLNFEKLPHEVISDNTVEQIWDASAENNELKYKALVLSLKNEAESTMGTNGTLRSFAIAALGKIRD